MAIQGRRLSLAVLAANVMDLAQRRESDFFLTKSEIWFIHISTVGIDAPGPPAWRQEAAALFETFQTTTPRASWEAEEFFYATAQEGR